MTHPNFRTLWRIRYAIRIVFPINPGDKVVYLSADDSTSSSDRSKRREIKSRRNEMIKVYRVGKCSIKQGYPQTAEQTFKQRV